MVTTKLYLDTRATDVNAPLKINVTKNRKSAFLKTGIKINADQWDKKRLCVVNHLGARSLNMLITQKKLAVDMALANMDTHGKTALQIRDALKRVISDDDEEEDGNFYQAYLKFVDSKSNQGTKKIYVSALKRIGEYDGRLKKLKFEDIDKNWLTEFDKFMEKRAPSRNARNMIFKCIKAVFNSAIDDELTQCYPFRKFQLKNEPTRKRSLSVEDLRILFDFPLTGSLAYIRDIFKLMFFLIGINTVDLLLNAEIINGRVEYRRAKTKKLYSIKLEPEAMKLLESMKGNEHLLSIMDGRKNFGSVSSMICIYLWKISDKMGIHRISPYWSRHSWATIAAELDIPKETIAAALGHEIGNPVTSIYIRFDQKKVDEANRKVMDYVLYNKR